MSNNKYIRVGTQYFKFIDEPDPRENDKHIRILSKWSRNTIIDDYGKEFCMSIEKFDDFTVKPSHDNFQERCGLFYNLYYPLSGKIKEGDYTESTEFLKHIFGDQFELGLDYLTILWRYPMQVLPILCLVSEERETGKTTFLNWLKEIFDNNMTIIKSESFRSRFNNDWTSKLIICIDEAKFDKKSDSDYIKDLSTSKTVNEEGKNINKRERPFFGKIIMASNNVTDMAVIDENETRYWVVEVNKIKNYRSEFESLLRGEIGAFKYFLKHRKIKAPKKTRMWFQAKDLRTPALRQMMKNSIQSNEKEIAEILLQYIEITKSDIVKLALKDLSAIFKNEGLLIKKYEIKKILTQRWKLEPTENATSYKYYVKYFNYNKKTDDIEVYNCKGRVYSFDKEILEKKVENC
jgi:hypothetical protein